MKKNDMKDEKENMRISSAHNNQRFSLLYANVCACAFPKGRHTALRTTGAVRASKRRQVKFKLPSLEMISMHGKLFFLSFWK